VLWNADSFAPTECIALTVTAMLAIRLSEKIENRLGRLAKRTGRTKTYYAREAILQHLEELEDIYLAGKRLEAVHSGRSRTIPLEKVIRR
jgi:RHH-type transcriptional regulator, rel operon repressor / antitoxin RelB